MQGGAGAAGGGAGAAVAAPTPEQTLAMQYIHDLWGSPEGAVLGDEGKRVLEDLFGVWLCQSFRFQKATTRTPLGPAPHPRVPSLHPPIFPVPQVIGAPRWACGR